MNHLDEGTIHAWLDGAVDATRAREIESHVADCAQCAAAVAEARGFVAGASRILNALDDVPAGVTPRRAVAPRRQWRAAPWVTGIAAALVLAIGVTTWNRDGARMAEVESAPKAEKIEAGIQPPPAPATPAASADVAGAPSAQPSVVGKDAAPRRGAAASSGRVNALADARGRGVVGAASGAGAASRDAVIPREQKVDVAAAASAPVSALAKQEVAPTAPMAPDTTRLRRRSDDRSVRLDNVVVTSTDETRLRRVREPEIDEVTGCYRIPARPAMRELVPKVVEIAGAVTRRAAPTSVAAPARPSAEYVAPNPPLIVLLDTVRQSLGYTVRAASSDSAMGSWNRIGTDSVRVDLLAAGVFTFNRRDRVSCPQP